MTPQISQAADDLIVSCEVSSRATYEKKYQRPEWPGERSGITVGIGYDLGYATDVKVRKDWDGRLPGATVDAMLTCVGAVGEDARRLLPTVRNKITVPWDAAIYVYEHVDIPQWIQRVCMSIPKADKLSPDCLGALTSLAYNRGASFQTAGDRYREMRAIRAHVMAGELDLVDDEIRSMKRLWPNTKGLQIRRDREADLWNVGLKTVAAPKTITREMPAPLAPIAKPGSAEAGSGTGGVIATGASAQQAASAGLSPWIVGGIVVAGLVVTVGTVAYIRYRRSQPIVARAKG